MTRPAQPSPEAARAARILYVSDVDHTLLGSDGTLSRYSRDTLNSRMAAGLRFTVASARSCASLRHLLAGLHLTLPVVDFNGSFVSDLATGRHHVVHAVAPALLEDRRPHITIEVAMLGLAGLTMSVRMAGHNSTHVPLVPFVPLAGNLPRRPEAQQNAGEVNREVRQ